MSRHNHESALVHEERFSFNGTKLISLRRVYAVKTFESDVQLMTRGKHNQLDCSCCETRLVGLLFDSRLHCKCCGNVVCADCSANAAVIEGHESWGAQPVCDDCFEGGKRSATWGTLVAPAAAAGRGDDPDEDVLLKAIQKRKHVKVISPVGMVANSSVDNCMGCDVQFGWTVFKHHCRFCGNVMCSDCLPHQLQIAELYPTPQKACKFCYDEQKISKETEFDLKGDTLRLRRIHVGTSVEGSRAHVGWVLDCCSDKCMLCADKFGAASAKLHCRACGDVVCWRCSTRSVNLSRRKQIGQQRVCDRCYSFKKKATHQDKNRRFSISTSVIDPMEVDPASFATREFFDNDCETVSDGSSMR